LNITGDKTMTRKDYIKFAEMYKTALSMYTTDKNRPVCNALIHSLINDTCIIFHLENPGFDANRFKAACGIND